MAFKSGKSPRVSYVCDYQKSLWVNQKLVLRNNPLLLKRATRHVCAPSMPVIVQNDAMQYAEVPQALYQMGEDGLYNAVYADFKNKVWRQAQASLAVDIAERRETVAMITDQAGRLYKAARHIKRFQFKKAARLLGLSRVPRGVSRKKVVSDNWLAYNFGWAPVVGSIYDGLDVLGTLPIDHFVKVSKKSPMEDVKYPSAYNYYIVSAGLHRITLSARVRVSDPNVARASQWGLTNPVGVVWELIPFSFVLDYFTNIGDMIESINPFMGLAFQDVALTDTRQYMYERWGTRYKPHTVEVAGTYQKKERKLGTVPPPPSFRINLGITGKQAANLLALTISILKG